MNAQLSRDDESESLFLLRDYSTLKRYWRIHTHQSSVVRVCETENRLSEHVHGFLEQWRLAGKETTMGFLSLASSDGAVKFPDYSRNLLMVVNERLLGDGWSRPHLKFQKGFLTREITIWTEDGWSFHSHYSAPWARGIMRKLNLGGTLEYDPVDFIERLIEIVSLHRPKWLESS